MKTVLDFGRLTLRRAKPIVVGLVTYTLTGVVMPDYPLSAGWRSVV